MPDIEDLEFQLMMAQRWMVEALERHAEINIEIDRLERTCAELSARLEAARVTVEESSRPPTKPERRRT